MERIRFEFDDVESKIIREFEKKHWQSCPHGASGGQISYTIVPTGIGVFSTIKCNYCGEILKIDNGEIYYISKAEYDKQQLVKQIKREGRQIYSKDEHSFDDLYNFARYFDYAIEHYDEFIDLYKEKGIETVIEEVNKNSDKYLNERIEEIKNFFRK